MLRQAGSGVEPGAGGRRFQAQGGCCVSAPDGDRHGALPVQVVLDALPVACLLVDADNRITAANENASLLLNRPADRLVDVPLDDLLPDLRCTPPEPKGALSGPHAAHLIEITDPTGEDLTLMAHIGPSNDDLEGRLVLLEDASDMDDPERELQRYAEELERSNRDLEQFVYGASHDLKEPLRVIEGHLRLLERAAGDDLPATAQESMAYALDGVHRLQGLIQGLLSYSRAGFREEPFEPVDAQAALDEALANLSVAIEESGAEVTHDRLPTVLGDRVQLAMVFQNLISNAIKFTPEDRTPKVHVGTEQDDQRPHLYVEDNGIGIAPGDQDRLFDMFERLHGPDEYPGSGIGLALCKRILEHHGGDIWVESEPGQGATFHLSLGTETQTAQEGKDGGSGDVVVEASADGHGDAYSVLLVDDVEGIRALVRMALEAKDRFEIVGEAGTGQEGIDLARETQPDLVLLDLSMPGMDGLEALPRIKEVAPGTKVAIYSGFQGKRLAKTALERGAIGYMEKGADPEEIEAELLRMVQEQAEATA